MLRIDITEVWAFLNEKKVTIKDLTDGLERRPAKVGPGKQTPGEIWTPAGRDHAGEEWRHFAGGHRPDAEDEKKARSCFRRQSCLGGRHTTAGKLKHLIRKHSTAAAKAAQKLLDVLK